MPAHPKDPAHVASRTRAARITPAEDAALDVLLRRRAAEMEARSEPGDPSFAGWLRWVIRREAKAAGGEALEALTGAASPPAPSPAPRAAKKSSTPKRRRGAP